MTKTNVMRLLDAKGIKYEAKEYDPKKAVSALEVASFLHESVSVVFKTLVTVSKSKEHYVFVIPADKELNLKKAAKAAEEKNIEMIPQKDLLPLTGYIHGGCSPIGQKKQFRTFVDESALLYDYFYISGGKLGTQVKISPADLESMIGCIFVSLTD
ncbi:MAG: Cys-tRNA(Pro) deacylase [Bacilli bacterium]